MTVAGQTQALLGSGVVFFSALAFYGMAWAVVAVGVIGLALLITGVIGWCPIQAVLRQMPWNRSRPSPSSR